MSETDLFNFAQPTPSQKSINAETSAHSGTPLAFRMRPTSLAEFVGQTAIVGSDQPLQQWIESDRVPSLILWGPPGTGKTSLATIIAQSTRSRFVAMNAVLSGVRDVKEAVATAKQQRELNHRQTILFIDEIHRFNKNQQDALLPHVESGTVTLIGATTENPSFEVNSALLSRCRVLSLDRLDSKSIRTVLDRAIVEPVRGLTGGLNIEEKVLNWIAETSEGDLRRALTAVENIHAALGSRTDGESISLEEANQVLGRKSIPHDKSGEDHYNVVSAFIKSIRGSDPDAAIYYLARMIEGGEDPKFICRRLIISASEDIGNADPRALQIALAAKDAVVFVGLPEARINLAQAVVYLACAPKSNSSYLAIDKALAEVRKSGALPVPRHLRNAPTQLMKSMNYGKGYQYAHDQEVTHSHLPEELEGQKFFDAKAVGYEKHFVPKPK